jgi:hypothetical protein
VSLLAKVTAERACTVPGPVTCCATVPGSTCMTTAATVRPKRQYPAATAIATASSASKIQNPLRLLSVYDMWGQIYKVARYCKGAYSGERDR